MRFIKKENAIDKIEFQRTKMIEYLNSIKVSEKTKSLSPEEIFDLVADVADDYFRITKHGLEEHITEYECEEEHVHEL